MIKHFKKASSCIFLILSILVLSFSTAQAQVMYESGLKGTEDGVGFLLTWTTSSEENNQFFVVERSTDGTQFKSIGSLNSTSEGDVTHYEFKDLELGLENASYRLKHVSSDESSSYSDKISLKKQFVSFFEVVNKEKLTEEVLQVTVNSLKEGQLECRLSNNMGDIIMEESKTLQIGLNDFVFDFTSEIDDTYHLIFKQKNVLETVVFKKETKEKKGNVAKKKSSVSGG